MSPPRHLVLLHGLASTPKEFGLLVHPLRRLGVTVHAPRVRGYTDPSPMAAAHWQDWVEAATQAVLESVGPAQPFVLGGLCTGAVLALAVAAGQAGRNARGLALLSPLFAYDGWGLPWWYRARGLAYLLGIEQRFSMAERPPYGLKNQRLRQLVQQQLRDGEATLAGTARISLQAVRESERLSGHARALVARLQSPTLVLHAREDEICRLASVEAAISAAPKGLLELAVLENSYHMISADNDRVEVAQRLAAHAAACLAPDACHLGPDDGHRYAAAA